MAFIIGNRRSGFAVKKLDRKKKPWEGQVWSKGKMVWRDSFETREQAEKYMHQHIKLPTIY